MKPLIIIGDGAHAEVLICLCRSSRRKILGLTSLELPKGSMVLNVPVLGNDRAIDDYSFDEVELVNGIGSANIPKHRKSIFTCFKEKKYRFATLIHPSALVEDDVIVGEGSQVMAGAIVQTGGRIDCNVIINTGAVVDHHFQVGSHSHIAPGVVCSGRVTIGSQCHVGSGATIIQGITLQDNVLVGAGAVVVNDIMSDDRVKGVPARKF